MKVSPALLRTASPAVALLVLGLLIYSDFVFGEKTLLYKDIGSDSANISYPYYVLLSDYLRHVGIPSWSFSVGMGQNLFPYVWAVLLTPVTWLAKAAIAKALVYQHLLYVLVAGWLFFQFLRDRGLAKGSSALGAMLLSFSAYMCMGSCWYFHAHEVVCFAFILFAAERAVNRGQWFYLVLAVAAVGLLGPFHLYLCALLLSFYVPARLIGRYGWQPRTLLRTSCLLAMAAALGVGLGAVVTADNLYSVVNSPRGSTAIATNWPTPALVFQLGSPLYYLTAALRSFSNDILGIGNDFRGVGNYLEAPVTYAGLFCLLMFPQVFIHATRRQRILYCGFVCFILLPIVFPWFRFVFWLFQGGYFRTFSLFSVLGIITLSMTALSRYTERRTFNFWVLGATLAALLGVLYLPTNHMQALIDPGLKQLAVILLIVYAALLATGQILKQQAIAGWIILGVSAIELLHFDRITVSSRPTVTKQELNERVGYNDETRDAVRDIKSDDQSFFRITKTWGSGPAIHSSLNDAMVFGYYGTSSYSSFNNLNYINFLMAVDAISGGDLATQIQWSKGLEGHRLLSAFACEKYVLTKNPVPFETAGYYEFVKRYGDIYLFRNQLFLPLGLTFSQYIPEDMFLQLPARAKPLALLHAVVLSEKDAADTRGLTVLTMDELQRKVSEVLPSDIVAERQDTSFQMRSFKETRIEGTVRSDGSRILVIQTPFDRGWRARVDGRAAATLKVDAGLFGVVLNHGGQTVELRYRPPFLLAGAVVTLFSCCIFLWSLWKWPRVRLPSPLE